MQNFDIFRLDGHAMRVFVSVCETASVSRTAEQFGVNQSTISHTLDKLRAALGDPLFVKSGRGITPTGTALALVPRVQRILAELEGLITPGDFDVTRDRRPIVIALCTPAVVQDVKTLHERLTQAAPGVPLALKRLAPQHRVGEMLSADLAELAIAQSEGRYPSMLSHCPYGTDELAVFYDGRCREPVRTAEDYITARHGGVGELSTADSKVAEALSRLGVRFERALLAPTTSMLGKLIEGTDMVITMPRRLAESDYRDLCHVPPPIALPPIHYDLVWHRRYEQSGRNLWLRRMVLQARQAPAPSGHGGPAGA